MIVGLEDIAQFPEIVRHHEEGTIPPTVMWGATPTQFNPSQAPPGRHAAFMWEKLPYRLRGDMCSTIGRKSFRQRRRVASSFKLKRPNDPAVFSKSVHHSSASPLRRMSAALSSGSEYTAPRFSNLR